MRHSGNELAQSEDLLLLKVTAVESELWTIKRVSFILKSFNNFDTNLVKESLIDYIKNSWERWDWREEWCWRCSSPATRTKSWLQTVFSITSTSFNNNTAQPNLSFFFEGRKVVYIIFFQSRIKCPVWLLFAVLHSWADWCVSAFRYKNEYRTHYNHFQKHYEFNIFLSDACSFHMNLVVWLRKTQLFC